MKNIGIITINNPNYGNRLQNYATQTVLNKLKCNAITIRNIALMNKKKNTIDYLMRNIKHIYKKKDYKEEPEKEKKFEEFDLNIKFSNKIFNWFDLSWLKKFDYFCTGSDQVWNPGFRLSDVDLLTFAENEKIFSFSASFGISELPEYCKENTAKKLKEFKKISVREDAGKKIVEELTGRKDVQVLVDPTMLLTAEEWDKVSKKPEQLKTDKYILNYFLGELSEERKQEINRVARENNCEIINILDKNSQFYQTGPSEFLYLEKNAFLICTDSFHSSVFSILYNRPFIVFEREQKGLESMNSRIETLINKFKLKNRKFTGKITEENLKHDYTEAYKILEEERKKSDDFLKKALDI